MSSNPGHNPGARDIDLASEFEVSAATVCGRQHNLAGRESQDAYAIVCTPSCLIGFVADGCGSMRHSELGAKLGVRLGLALLGRLLEENGGAAEALRDEAAATALLEQFRLRMCEEISTLSGKMTYDCAVSDIIAAYFLFTLLGFVVGPTNTAVFGIGDGGFGVNGSVNPIGPFPGNAPPYLAYGLPEIQTRVLATGFTLHAFVPTESLSSLIVATDGLTDLLIWSEFPEGAESFWKEDKYFRNPDALRRRLSVISREQIIPDWENRVLERRQSPLRDDTTLIVVRRKGGGP